MYYFNRIKFGEERKEEDCQIAGDMMGDVPANVNRILSLGYKPGKSRKSKDFDEIPKF
jgi:hypothetical protein